jgi:hypothetical protein
VRERERERERARGGGGERDGEHLGGEAGVGPAGLCQGKAKATRARAGGTCEEARIARNVDEEEVSKCEEEREGQ